MIALAIVELRAVGWQWQKLGMSPETLWLVCWSLGGLVVMSLLPSKRVDRIFPVIPPLCLLLGAQIRSAVSRIDRSKLILAWTTVALVFAVVFTSAYVGWKATSGYREHRDALARFGQQVRRETAAHKLRFAVVSSPDEGLLLYLRQTHFVLPPRATAQWNNGELDALVVSKSDAPAVMAELKPSGSEILHSSPIRSTGVAGYLFITKSAE